MKGLLTVICSDIFFLSPIGLIFYVHAFIPNSKRNNSFPTRTMAHVVHI